MKQILLLLAIGANLAPALFAAEKPALLAALKSPILFQGNDQIAYRDPLLIRQGGTFYSPQNGVGVKRSTDLVHWREEAPPLTFGQAGWPWAETRLTAGYVEDMRDVPGVGKYVIVFHASGPGKVRTELQENANAHLSIA